MQWSDVVASYVQALKPITPTVMLARRLYQSLDLTSLNASDTESSISAFCEKAQSALGHVAAICVYPQFVSTVAKMVAGTPIKIATVVNFPQGESSIETVVAEIQLALQHGANEIDVVFPYARYLAGERQYATLFIAACKAACGDAVMKVILETGVLNDPTIIANAVYETIAAGADFVKTSTGKLPQGASLEAAATMLLAIKQVSQQLTRPVGLKVSGGIRQIETAAAYLALAESIMGADWPSPATFRIGASQLADELLASPLFFV